jgi:hypothetical protein
MSLPPPPAAAGSKPVKKVEVTTGKVNRPKRVLIYGAGGIGKTTLAALAPKPIFLDLAGEDGTSSMDVHRIGGIERWEEVRSTLADQDVLKPYKTVVLDTGTRAQDFATSFMLRTIPHEKGARVNSIEDYGYGKGFQHLYDTFVMLLGDLDQQIRAGRNVILICHEATEKVPNPEGEDYLQYQPLLDKRIRSRVRDWSDFVVYMSLDKSVKKDKAVSAGSRTAYTAASAAWWAKGRFEKPDALNTFVIQPGDASMWDAIFATK